jgi:hypothetical protein
MSLILTPAHHRSAALLKVVTAFSLANDLSTSDKRVIVGKAKAIRLLVEAGTSTKKMVVLELDALTVTVKGMTDVGSWPEFITGYIEALRRQI